MTSSPGEQILGQYKEELSMSNYETRPAVMPAACNGREHPVTVRI